MEEIKIRELSEKSSINTTDYLVIEDEDGTKKVPVKNFRSLVLSTLYFNTIKELKESSNIGLKEGDICETLGYHTPGDGGGARYKITYNPSAVEDNKLIHYLAYSDTLRAEIILDDVVNVHQFGAVGDGVTDDTNAIQAAIDNSDSKVVEFSNNKKYCIKNTIIIKKSNTIINGNGAIMYPLYVDGINITTDNTIGNITNDVTINKLHFDCSRAVSAINLFRSTKIHISGCNIDKVTDTGIVLSNCSFVTIDNCHLIGNGQASGNLISITGEANNITTPSLTCKFIDIEDTKFSEFYRAINVIASGSTTDYPSININNCRYDSTINNSICIYASCPFELLTAYSSIVSLAGTYLFIGGASGGPVTCKDISCLNTSKIFDIGSTTCVLRLDGSINTSQNAIVFQNMNGKLYSNVMWESLNSGASFANKPTGEINDVMTPYNYNDTKGYTITGSRLTIHEARNMHINWTSSTNNLTEIVNGVKGQLMYLRSSTGKSITAVANKIVLSESAIKLGTYYGVMLKFDGSKWNQISNLTTVSALNNSIVAGTMGGTGNTPNGPIIVGGGTITDNNTKYTLLKDGDVITLAGSDGENSSVIDKDTTYELTDFGITATADELNKLANCNISKEEIEILNGLIVNTKELNYLYGTKDNVQKQIDEKAPLNHASTSTEYGIGTSIEYGHVKVADEFVESIGSAADGIVASQLAVHDSYTRVQYQIGDINTHMGNIDTHMENIDTNITEVNTEITNIKEGTTVPAKAAQLETARNILVDLASNVSALFNGSSDISPGVTGILDAKNGGTGASSLTEALTNLFSADSISYFPDSYLNLPYGSSHGVYSTLKAKDPFTSTEPKRVHAIRLKGNVNTESIIIVTSIDGGDAGRVFIGHHDGSNITWREISPANHNHSASQITSGTLSVARGGTGAATLASGQLLVGNGTDKITTRAITNNTSNTAAVTANTNIPTMNTLKNALNRATGVAAADTNYSTVMVRGIAAGTGAAPSNLPNGAIYVKYS